MEVGKENRPLFSERKNMIIGIDIDDTITETIKQIDIYAKEYTEQILKRNFQIHEIKSNDPMWARAVYGWTDEEDKNFWDLYYVKVIENVKPKKNAVKIINDLYQENEIIIITARWERESGTINKIIKEWFAKQNIKYHKLYMGHLDKRNIVQKNKIELFIDDSIKTCNEIRSLGVKTLIMTTRLNENIDTEGIIRVHNWDEINEQIKKLNISSK